MPSLCSYTTVSLPSKTNFHSTSQLHYRTFCSLNLWSYTNCFFLFGNSFDLIYCGNTKPLSHLTVLSHLLIFCCWRKHLLPMYCEFVSAVADVCHDRLIDWRMRKRRKRYLVVAQDRGKKWTTLMLWRRSSGCGSVTVVDIRLIVLVSANPLTAILCLFFFFSITSDVAGDRCSQFCELFHTFSHALRIAFTISIFFFGTVNQIIRLLLAHLKDQICISCHPSSIHWPSCTVAVQLFIAVSIFLCFLLWWINSKRMRLHADGVKVWNILDRPCIMSLSLLNC